jgi:hypothetical protein
MKTESLATKYFRNAFVGAVIFILVRIYSSMINSYSDPFIDASLIFYLLLSVPVIVFILWGLVFSKIMEKESSNVVHTWHLKLSLLCYWIFLVVAILYQPFTKTPRRYYRFGKETIDYTSSVFTSENIIDAIAILYLILQLAFLVYIIVKSIKQKRKLGSSTK